MYWFSHIGKLPNGWPCLKSPYNALQTLGHWLRHVCLCTVLLTCKGPAYRTFILVSGDQTFAFGNSFLPIIIYWSLKVFRGHFGPRVKFSGWSTVVVCSKIKFREFKHFHAKPCQGLQVWRISKLYWNWSRNRKIWHIIWLCVPCLCT